MAIRHADSFKAYGTNTAFMLNGVYAEVDGTLVDDPDPNITATVFRPSANGTGDPSVLRFPLPAGAVTTCGMAARVWCATLPTNDDRRPTPFQFADGSNNTLVQIMIDTSGTISAYRDNTLLGTSAVPAVTANAWWHIECKASQSATVGTVEVRVEGQTVLNLTGQNTGAASIASACVRKFGGSGGANTVWFIKDLVVWDTTGSSNNNFLGSVLVTNLVPNADAALNWTPTGAANGYSILDNSPPVDANYISAGVGPIPAAYVAEMTNLPAEATSVRAVVSRIRAAKSDGGDGSLQVGIISDPTGTPSTALGADRPITTAQTYWSDVFELDPDTGAAWLPAAVNASRLQINRTT